MGVSASGRLNSPKTCPSRSCWVTLRGGSRFPHSPDFYGSAAVTWAWGFFTPIFPCSSPRLGFPAKSLGPVQAPVDEPGMRPFPVRKWLPGSWEGLSWLRWHWDPWCEGTIGGGLTMLELPVLPRHIFLEQGEANLQTSLAGPAWP